MLSGKVNVFREVLCGRQRSMLSGKVIVAREGQCCQGSSMLSGKVTNVREGLCCRGRSMQSEKVYTCRGDMLCCEGAGMSLCLKGDKDPSLGRPGATIIGEGPPPPKNEQCVKINMTI